MDEALSNNGRRSFLKGLLIGWRSSGRYAADEVASVGAGSTTPRRKRRRRRAETTTKASLSAGGPTV